jgi:MFS family permease
MADILTLEERARYISLFSSVWGVSAVIGPAVGGFLTEQVSWRWVFFLNVPLCLLTLTLVSGFLHERLQRREHQVDYLGALLLTAAISALLLGLHASAAGETLALLGLSALSLVAFVWQERRAPEPLVPLSLFRQRVIGVAIAAACLAGVPLFGQGAFVPPLLQGVLGTTPTVAGLIVGSASVAWPLSSFVSTRWMLRVGYRIPATTGATLLVISFGLMGLLQPEQGIWPIFLVQLLLGVGCGCFFPVAMLAVQNAVAWDQRGVVTSAHQFARSMGGAVGLAVTGALFSNSVAAAAVTYAVDPNQLLSLTGRESLLPAQLDVLQAAVAASLQGVYLVIAGFSVLTVAMTVLLPGGRPSEHAWQEADKPTPASPPGPVAGHRATGPGL